MDPSLGLGINQSNAQIRCVSEREVYRPFYVGLSFSTNNPVGMSCPSCFLARDPYKSTFKREKEKHERNLIREKVSFVMSVSYDSTDAIS